MTKKLAVILVCVFTLSLLSVTAFADCGPKAFTNVYFDGFSGECYATLLCSEKGSGPDYEYKEEYTLRHNSTPSESKADRLMHEYGCNDEHFYYLGMLHKINGASSLHWGYYPPDTFKIMVVFPEYDIIAVSDVYSTNTLANYYVASLDVKDISLYKGQTLHIDVMENKHIAITSAALLLRMVLTILIEVGIAKLFHITEKRQRRFLIILNVATQLFLNILLNISVGTVGMLLTLMIVYAVLEVGIFVIEAIACCLFINRFSDNGTVISLPKLLLFTFLANTASLLAGLPLMVADGFIRALV